MKKICSLFLGIMMLVSCKTEASFKGHDYLLQDAENGARITLRFSATENQYSGKIVNNYFGSYEATDSTIKFSPAGATMMMGPEDLMVAETNFFIDLAKVENYELNANTLTLTTSEGKKLVFTETKISSDDE